MELTEARFVVVAASPEDWAGTAWRRTVSDYRTVQLSRTVPRVTELMPRSR